MKQGGWNKTTASSVPERKSHLGLCLASGACVAVLIIGTILFSQSEEEVESSAPEAKRTTSSQIVPDPKSAANSTSLTNLLASKSTAPKTEEKKPYKDQYGNLWIEKGRPYIDPKAETVVFDNQEPLEKVFKHTCNIRIGQMLAIEPGTEVEQQVFGDWFREDFKQSLQEKIEILPDDDEYTRSVKEAVIDVRKELMQRVKNGEDVSQIMTDTWEELYQLGRFKSDLESELIRLSENEDTSDEEIETLIESTDALLSEKGLPPFQNKRMLQRMMKFNIRQRRGAVK